MITVNGKTVKLEEWDYVGICKKEEQDKRKGEYWISLSTDGCGCCSESYYELCTKKEAIKILKEWIKIKEKEIQEMKKQIKEAET